MTASLTTNSALRHSIAGLANKGAREANKFHLLGSTNKNQVAAEQALDRISEASYESDPALAKNLSHLRGVGSELAPSDRLRFNRTLLDSLANQATKTSFQGVQGPLQVLGDLLSFSDSQGRSGLQGPLQAPLEQAFTAITGSSSDSVAQTAAKLESTSLRGKLNFAQVSEEQFSPTSFQARSLELFGYADTQDHSKVANLLLRQAKQYDGASSAQLELLSGLDAYRVDPQHNGVANIAISGLFNSFGHETVDYLLESATTSETRDIVLNLVDRNPETAPPDWANEGFAERLQAARAERRG